MASRTPLVLVSGQVQQLQSGDTLNAPKTGGDVLSQTNDKAGAIVIGTPVYNDAADGVKKGKADAAPTATYAGNLGMTDLWKQDKHAGHPLILASGEGFAIRVGTAQGATVAVKSVFVVEWVEVTAY